MDFRIADTFTDSLARLTGEEQKAVKTTAFDLQLNPASPGLSFHKLDKARDKSFWSVRVSGDIRLIVHRTTGSLLLCYVDHHDKAYAWAERRKLETHPKTGAAQLVEIRERIEEVLVPKYVDVPQTPVPKRSVFASISNETLFSYGVPTDWVDVVREATEDTILELIDHLPREAGEALLDLATGVTPRLAVVPEVTDPFEHPDAQRRFRVMTNVEELERALEYPWDKWTVFLHPSQREVVDMQFAGPARVSGSAGTGKTVVALHRAVYLARTNPDARVLLTTFSEPMANALRIKLKRLIGNEPRMGERLEVHSVDEIARRLYERNLGPLTMVTGEDVAQLLRQTAASVEGQKFSEHFLKTEWAEVVDAWQLGTWEAYRDVVRLGRKVRLPEKQREALWGIFARVHTMLAQGDRVTPATMLTRLATHVATLKNPPFEFVVVDEAQDVSVAQLRLLAALGGGRPNSLFFAGDLGQRIFQQPFSWKSLGVEIRGRAKTLRINYRTSHQIRSQADRLLGPEISDVDGNTESRRGAVSVFNGPAPVVEVFGSAEDETQAVAKWISDRRAEDVQPHEIAIFVRSSAEIGRARSAAEKAGVPFKVLDERVDTTSGFASISTMHLAKGLEFRAVAVMACDDEVIPLQERIAAVTDDSDLEEVYNTERHLLYVACTRAREFLHLSGVVPASEFLDDLNLALS